MYDEKLDRELPGGVEQFQFDDKADAFDKIKIKAIRELVENDN